MIAIKTSCRAHYAQTLLCMCVHAGQIAPLLLLKNQVSNKEESSPLSAALFLGKRCRIVLLHATMLCSAAHCGGRLPSSSITQCVPSSLQVMDGKAEEEGLFHLLDDGRQEQH